MRSPASLPETEESPKPLTTANPILECDANLSQSDTTNSVSANSKESSNSNTHQPSNPSTPNPAQCIPVPSRSKFNPNHKTNAAMKEFPFLDPQFFTFKCIYPECKETFNLTNDLYDHIRSHSKDLKCPVCERKYKCMASLVYHVRTHSQNKPYICPLPLCKFVTATKGNLKAHLLSNQHKDAMSLQLLNVILSMDTKHGRPETVMHGPRERKKYRKRMHDFGGFFQPGPPMKRRRSSIGSIGMPGMPPQAFENGMQFMQMNMNAMTVDPSGPPLPQQAQWTPMAIQQPQQFAFGTFAPVAQVYQANMSSTDGFYHPPPDTSQFETPLPLTSLQPKDEEHHGHEDLTVRIKSGLLRSIEHAENFRSINAFGAADQLSLAMGNIESTTGFYGERESGDSVPKSAFKMSQSNTPPFEQRYRRDSTTDLLDDDLQLVQMDQPLIF